eukprot:605383-Hanusia_phi.AAC.7
MIVVRSGFAVPPTLSHPKKNKPYIRRAVRTARSCPGMSDDDMCEEMDPIYNPPLGEVKTAVMRMINQELAEEERRRKAESEAQNAVMQMLDLELAKTETKKRKADSTAVLQQAPAKKTNNVVLGTQASGLVYLSDFNGYVKSTALQKSPLFNGAFYEYKCYPHLLWDEVIPSTKRTFKIVKRSDDLKTWNDV